MREVLFRGKRISNSEWVEGFYVGAIADCSHEICDIDSVTGHRVEVDPATVGQYAGMKDKNGHRIFEGDILKVTWGVAGRVPVVSYLFVEFAKGIFETKRIKDNKPHGMVSTYVSKEVGDCGVFCEVIGNIHDNPELMEVQNV